MQPDRPVDSKDYGILLVAFGTTREESRKGLDSVFEKTRTAFPHAEVRWAYTSRAVRARLGAEGVGIDSPEMALVRMIDDGLSRMGVLSLHLIPGREHHDLHQNVKLISQMHNGRVRIASARPLLSAHADMKRVAEALIKRAPQELTSEDAVIFMGHGSKGHPSDAIYTAMNGIIQEIAPHIFLATMDGYPKLDDLLPKLQSRGVKRVYLKPFMAVAGTHVYRDLAGDIPQSWKSILTGQGFVCEVSFQGIIEYPDIVEIWLGHLKEALSKL